MTRLRLLLITAALLIGVSAAAQQGTLKIGGDVTTPLTLGRGSEGDAAQER
jgi:hypothetical protein